MESFFCCTNFGGQPPQEDPYPTKYAHPPPPNSPVPFKTGHITDDGGPGGKKRELENPNENTRNNNKQKTES